MQLQLNFHVGVFISEIILDYLTAVNAKPFKSLKCTHLPLTLYFVFYEDIMCLRVQELKWLYHVGVLLY